MTNDTAVLVRQMREALAARRAFDTEPGCAINRRLYGAMDRAIASADQWLAQQRGPLTDEEIARMWMAGYSDGSGDSMVNLFARAIERAHGIGQPAGEDKR